jgi:hypothetical protein
MRGMMSKERKNVMAAVLLVAAVLTASVPARAEGPARGVREVGPGTAWVVRILGWLGLPPQRLGSIWESSSAYIDPNGQPTLNSGGGGTGIPASSDSSANIDPNG